MDLKEAIQIYGETLIRKMIKGEIKCDAGNLVSPTLLEDLNKSTCLLEGEGPICLKCDRCKSN